MTDKLHAGRQSYIPKFIHTNVPECLLKMTGEESSN